MDMTERFAAVVRGPEADLRLDEAALLISAHADRSLDVEDALAELDRLASTCPGPALEDLCHHLFVDLGFRGDTEEYDAPANSLLAEVVERRKGMPITLSVLLIEVGRRLGLTLDPVGMPGHFLVADRSNPGRFVDAFGGGTLLDPDGCERIFRSLHRAQAAFDPRYLEPSRPRAVVARILANLTRSYAARGERSGLLWAQCLRVLVPGATVRQRRELAAALAANGRFAEAATELEALADEADDDSSGPDVDRAAAQRLRARLN